MSRSPAKISFAFKVFKILHSRPPLIRSRSWTQFVKKCEKQINMQFLKMVFKEVEQEFYYRQNFRKFTIFGWIFWFFEGKSIYCVSVHLKIPLRSLPRTLPCMRVVYHYHYYSFFKFLLFYFVKFAEYLNLFPFKISHANKNAIGFGKLHQFFL